MEDAERKALVEAQSLSERGYYADAIRILNNLTAKPRPPLEATLELGQTLLRQGYYNRALHALDRGLNSNLDDLHSSPFYQATRLLRCLVFAVVTAKIVSSLRDAKRVFEECTLENKMDHTAVLATTYYGTLIRFCHDTKVETRSVENDLFPKKLQTAFVKLTQDGEFSDALRIACTHDSWPNISGSESLLSCLANDACSSPLIRAKAQFYLSEKLERSNNHVEADRLMDSAIEGFNSVRHRHGALDISTTRKLRSADTMSDAFVTESIAAYDEMDYPSGLQAMLRKFLNLAYCLHVFNLQVEITINLESLSERTGTRLIGLMTRLQTLAIWSQPMTHNAKVATGAAELYTELQDSECQFMIGQAAYTASMAFSSLKDNKSASLWAERCQQAWKSCTKSDESTAATWSLNIRLQDHPDEEILRDIVSCTMLLVQRDIEENLLEKGAEKLSILLSGLLGAGPKIRTTFVEQIKSIWQQLENILNLLPMADKRWATLYQDQASFLLADSDTQEDTSSVEHALKLLDKAVEIYLKGGSLFEAANCRQMGGVCQISLMKKHLRRNDRIALARDLDNALELFSVAKDAFEAMQNPSGTGTANYWIAWCLHEAWVQGWTSAEVLLKQITEAEQNTSSQRSEISVLGGLSAITNKQALSSSKHTRHLYEFAVEICFRKQDEKMAWDWIQKGKARSLSDLLGLGILVPETLRANIAQHEESQGLFDKEKGLLEAIADSSNQDRFPLRVELEKHREKMKGDPLLRELLDLREGTPIQLGSMQVLLRSISSSRRTVCIDWITSGPRIYLFAVYANADPVFRLLAISLPEVQAWIREYFDHEEGRSLALSENDEDNPFRELDPLVGPLSEFSDPGDLLVLCPTGPLHSLPLHALWISDCGTSGPGAELVERNPFVYCASMTSFAQCCYRARDNPPKEMIGKDFVSVYEREDEEGDFDADEQSKVYSSMASLASLMPAGEALVGGHVTGPAFGKIIESSHLIHFHGHCDGSNATSIVEQSLRLTAGPGSTGSSSFTVRDFLAHKMQAPLFTLAACSSATQGISVGDEPLGLVTAILCAGASSVVGTLWPVESATARKFSERFYHKLARRTETTVCVFDLPMAIQETMSELKSEFRTRRLYNWAPFVLHGACFSRIPIAR